MNNKIKILSFLVLFNFCFNLKCDFKTRIKNIIGNIITLPISNSNVNDEVKKLAEETVKEIYPKIEITSIKSLNKLGQLLLGYQNTVAIPFLNVLIVNDKWLKKLPENSRKFVIGRAAVHMNNGLEYISYKYLLPLVLYNFLNFTIPKKMFNQYLSNRNLNPREAKLINKVLLEIIKNGITNLITAYFSRSLEYEADAEAAYKLKSPEFAIKALKDINKFKHDKTILGNINSKIPLLKLLNLLLIPKFAFSQRDPFVYKKVFKYYGFVFLILNKLRIFAQIEANTPGRINNVSNQLENFFIHFPIINWFCNFPRMIDRIKHLRKVAKKLKHEHEIGDLEAGELANLQQISEDAENTQSLEIVQQV